MVSRSIAVVRTIVFFGLAAYILLAPGLRQVLGFEWRYIQTWQMFTSRALGILVVQYRVRDRAGIERLIDYQVVLGSAAKKGGRIRDMTQAVAIGRRLCGRLGRNRNIRLYARKAVTTGWEWHERGERNLCNRAETP